MHRIKGERSSHFHGRSCDVFGEAVQETEEERQARYAREADEMKLKWDARPGICHLIETARLEGTRWKVIVLLL